jgi:hypothetical protein
MVKADKENKEIAESKAYDLLEQQDFLRAVHVMAQYEASQEHSRGVGIDWKNYDGASMVDALKVIFNSTPAILNNIEESQLNQIRVAAGMMRLWGARTAQRWIPKGIDKATLDAWNVASWMLDFHATHLARMQMFKDAGVRNVEVSGIADDRQCPECKKIDGKLFKLEDAPELPYVKCTCEMGCRCLLIAEDKFWKNG